MRGPRLRLVETAGSEPQARTQLGLVLRGRPETVVGFDRRGELVGWSAPAELVLGGPPDARVAARLNDGLGLKGPAGSVGPSTPGLDSPLSGDGDAPSAAPSPAGDPFAVADAGAAVSLVGVDGLVHDLLVYRRDDLVAELTDAGLEVASLVEVTTASSSDGSPAIEVAQLTAALADDDDGLAALADRAGMLVGGVGSVLLPDHPGGTWSSPLGRHTSSAWRRLVGGRSLARGGLGACEVLTTGRPVVTNDVGGDPLWTAAADLSGVVGAWAVPIRGCGPNVIGVLEIHHSRPLLPEPGQLEVLLALGHIAGLALDGHIGADRPEGGALSLLDRMSQRLDDDTSRRHGHALVVAEIDGASLHRETVGPAGWQQVVHAVGERLGTLAGDAELCGWIGADRFAMLWSRLEDGDHALEIADVMLRTLERPIELSNVSVLVRCSTGVGMIAPGVAPRLLDSLHDALLGVQAAAHQGGSAVVEGATVVPSQPSGDDVRRALNAGEFGLLYQPMVTAASRELAGVEALLRWETNGLPGLDPRRLVASADRGGFAIPVGEWVVRTAGAAAAVLDDEVRPAVWVNVSGALIASPNWLEALGHTLDLLDGLALGLEIPEEVASRDVGRSRETCEALAAMGVAVGVDDFGVHRSLEVLASLPLDVVKLDARLQHLAASSERGLRVVECLVGAAQGLGTTVVAKGIEDEAAAELMTGLGCDLLQGFAISAPAPLHELVGDT